VAEPQPPDSVTSVTKPVLAILEAPSITRITPTCQLRVVVYRRQKRVDGEAGEVEPTVTRMF
jgi:hypothetical protein